MHLTVGLPLLWMPLERSGAVAGSPGELPELDLPHRIGDPGVVLSVTEDNSPDETQTSPFR